MENIHAFCIFTAVVLAGLNVIALYWLARRDRVINDMAQALLHGASQIQFASGVIEGQRLRIRELEAELDGLEAEIGRLTDSNIIELPTGPRREPRQF